jgi:hypothetical protein
MVQLKPRERLLKKLAKRQKNHQARNYGNCSLGGQKLCMFTEWRSLAARSLKRPTQVFCQSVTEINELTQPANSPFRLRQLQNCNLPRLSKPQHPPSLPITLIPTASLMGHPSHDLSASSFTERDIAVMEPSHAEDAPSLGYLSASSSQSIFRILRLE